jgi:two-component system response regulator YesN
MASTKPKGVTPRIMLVEDNALFRETFKEQLRLRFPLAIIEEAAKGDEALQKITEHPPQIIFMDLSLPGESGLQLTQKIKARFPDVHIAMLTWHDIFEYRQESARLGADRYFVKDSVSWDEIGGFIESYSA